MTDNGFDINISESTRPEGFDKKVQKHIELHGSIEKDGSSWMATVTHDLWGRKLRKPLIATGRTKSGTVRSATMELLNKLPKRQGVTMIPVESSNIKSAGYDKAKRVLYVEFKSGAVYQYRGVPETRAVELMNASSVGQYLNSKIKGTFDFDRLV